MIKSIKWISLVLFCFFLLKNISYPETSLNISVNPAIPSDALSLEDIGMGDMVTQIQTTTDLNGPFVADAFALANILGYPIGKAYLGSFPHFEIGISAGAGCTNMKYFDEDDPASDNGTLPVFAPNPVTHFGLGLFGGFDILGKAFYISKSAVNRYSKDIDYETDVATLSDFMIYSIGGKLRYNIVKRKRFLPFYLAFGGISLSFGSNFIYGKIAFSGEYEYDFEGISIDMPDGTQEEIGMHFNGQFGADINWSIFSSDVQAIAYFDIFYLFSLYSGFGVAGNIGSFNLEFGGTGQLTATSVDLTPVFGTNEIGSLIFISKNKYRPSPVIPTYILGLEINLLVIKLNVETMVNMLNRSDVNAQGGFRIQF